MIRKVFDAIFKATKWITIVLLALMVLLILVQVFFRYVLNNALPWPEEVARYTFAWLTLLALGLCMADDGHLRLDVLKQFISKESGKKVIVFADLVSLGFFLFFGWLSISSVKTYFEQGTLAVSFPLPIWIVWLCIPIGCLLTALQLAKKLLSKKDS